MIADTAVKPRLGLPAWLRIMLAWNRMVQFASFPASGGCGASSTTLEEDFKKLIACENATISKICFSYAGSVAEFDDLRQDALVNIWRGMQNFRGDAARKTWIYRVTVNSCLSTIRKQIRHRHESLDGLYGIIEGDDSNREAIEQIHRAIGLLGAQEKAIIMMWLDELSYDEIASAMGLNRNTIATKIRRIKEKIAKEYNRENKL